MTFRADIETREASDTPSLARLSQAERLLAEATVEELPQVAQLVDYAEVVRVFAERARLGTAAVNHATKIKLQAERTLADLVDEGQATGRIATRRDNQHVRSADKHTLADLGVSRRRLAEARVIRDAFTADDIAERVDEADAEDRIITRRGVLTVAKQKNPDLYTSESVNWWTPSEILKLTVDVLRGIDLDPCSNLGTPNVPAAAHFTVDDDGLAQPWAGTIYMNPPYGDALGGWVEKLASAYEAGDVSAAIALVPSRTDTRWFRRLAVYPRCFIWGRLRFSGQPNSAPFPSMVVYLGGEVDRFVRVFSTVGDIYGRLS